jgi:hypothetical protein
MTAIVGLQGKTAPELVNTFKVYRAQVENQNGRTIKQFGSDGGGEFQKEFGQHLREKGIIREVMAPYCPEQNGVSERSNRNNPGKDEGHACRHGTAQEYEYVVGGRPNCRLPQE